MTARASIQQLSATLINKIAAGEVIERPASVVKELMENAVDAGATRIDVTVLQGGNELIRVVDNGHGIPADELPLAVISHATSKIGSTDDLFRVQTMGFRGEALASIASVSQLRLTSRTHDSDAGATLEVSGGQPGNVELCGCSIGTAVQVRDLFFNTPVRRKFLRTNQTEAGHASEAFTRLALGHPRTHMVLRHQQRVVFDLPPAPDVRERVRALLGMELAESLIPVESQDGPVRVHGYVAHPDHSRSTNKLQYLFLNGRHIRDRALQHALGEAYRGLLLTGRYPIAVLHLEMPPELVDVNVHPTKLEVRFQDGGRLYSQLLGMIRNRFLTTDLTAVVQPSLAAGPAAKPLAPSGPARIPGGDGSAHEPSSPRPWTLASDPARQQALLWPASSDPNAAAAPSDSPPGPVSPTGVPPDDGRRPSPVPGDALASAGPRALQIHDRYLITEADDGIVVIDQHALHERILYEQLRQKVVVGQVEKQRLLVPEVVQLTPSESAAILQAQPLLTDLGIEVADFGGDAVVVSSYPAMLANFEPGEMIRQLADQLQSGGTPERGDLLDGLLHMISCKAAIKAGDRLTPVEIEALIDQRHLVQDAHHCPHGRPTTLVFTRKELDHRFKRT
jgi:DNA mismatch repair protein MutL